MKNFVLEIYLPKKLCFDDFSKTAQYFFPDVSRPLRRVLKTSLVKILERKYIYANNFELCLLEIFSPKNQIFRRFLKNCWGFFPEYHASLKRVFKTSVVKITTKKNIYNFSPKTHVFDAFSKITQYFFLNISVPLRRVFKTSFEKKKIKNQTLLI